MKLYEKIERDIESAEKNGYQIAVSFGSYQTFCRLKKLEPANFDENLKLFNEYLKPHNLACIKTRKGLRYTRVKYLKEFSKKKKEKKKEDVITL